MAFGRRIKKAFKKVGGKALRLAGGVAKSMMTGQSLQSAVRKQVSKEIDGIAGQGAYRRMKQLSAGPRRIRGRGDYEVAGTPGTGGSLMNPRTAFEPRMKNEVGIIEIARSEYITDILSSATGTPSAFNLQNFFVNPGLDISNGGASAWLAPIGASFQQYKYKQLVFEFRSTSGASVASANTSLGTVIMASNYDPSRANYNSKQAMMDSQFAVSGSPDKSIMFPVECKSALESIKLWDVRTSALLPNQSQNTYDFVNFQIATQGMQSNNVNLGELWVHYTVCLEKTNTSSASSTIRTAHYYLYDSVADNSISADWPFGNGAPPSGQQLTPAAGNAMNLTVVATTVNLGQILLPASILDGVYFVRICWAIPTAHTWAEPTLSLVNANPVSNCFLPFDPSRSIYGEWYTVVTTPTQTNYTMWFAFSPNGGGAAGFQVVAGGSTLSPGLTSLDVLVTELNATFVNG